MSSTKTRGSVKQTMSGISGRRKRQETMISIRKARKEDGYAARRNMAAAAKADKATQRSEIMKTLGDRTQSLLVGIAKPDEQTQAKSLNAFVLLMASGVPPLFDDSDPQYEPLWQTILTAVPSFVSFLSAPEGKFKMKCDAAFALRFISSMERSKDVLKANALPGLMLLLQSGVSELQTQAAWCLGNIAGESPECCAQVLQVCTPAHVLPHVRMSTPALRRAAVWLLRSLLDHMEVLTNAGALPPQIVQEIASVLCQVVSPLAVEVAAAMEQKADPIIAPWRMFEMKTGKQPPNDLAVVRFSETIDAETVKVADLDVNFVTGRNEIYIAKLADLNPLESIDDDMNEEDQEEILNERDLTICDSCWGLVEVSLAHPNILPSILSMSICQALVQILSSYTSSILCSPALRLFENIVSGNAQEIQAAVDSGVIHIMPNILFNPSKIVREEACWFLSNIAAGTTPHVEAILREPHLMVRLAEQLAWAEWDVRREAAWVICNIIVRAPSPYMKDIIKLGVLDSFATLLSEKDPQVSLLVLEALSSILRSGVKETGDPSLLTTYKTVIEEAGCIDKIEELCYDNTEEVSTMASVLLDNFFQDQDDEAQESNSGVETTEDKSMFVFKPVEAQGQTFNFGGN